MPLAFAVCFTPRHGRALPMRKKLESQLRECYRRHIQESVLLCVWIDVPEGSAFVGGDPSSLSSVLVSVPDDLVQYRREAFMQSVSAMWTEACAGDEHGVMVAACGRSLFRTYLAKSGANVAMLAARASL